MKPIERIKHLKSCRIDTDKDRRVKIDVAVMSKLKALPYGNYYREVIIKDKNLMGFRARVSPGGQRAFIYRYRPRGKDEKGNYFENSRLSPYNVYGWTKLGSEIIIKTLNEYVIIRTRFFDKNVKSRIFKKACL